MAESGSHAGFDQSSQVVEHARFDALNIFAGLAVQQYLYPTPATGV